MATLTRAQLIDQLGGDPAAAQLLQDRTTGGIDFAKLDAAIADAVGDIEAAVATRYQSVSQNPPQKIVRIARQLGAYYAWSRAGNKVMPEVVRQLYGAAKADLREIQSSESPPGPNSEVWFGYQTDNSDGGRRLVHSVARRSLILGAR
jgi:phage gp36-like protein